MNSVSHPPEKADGISASSRALPERVLLASFLALVALGIFLLRGLDDPLFRAIYGSTNAGTALLWRGISRLGSGVVLAPVVAAIAVLLFRRKQGLAAMALAFGWAATTLTVELLKWLLDRSRPLVPHWTVADGAAFPSGHAAQALYVSVFLQLLLADSISPADRGVSRRGLPRPWRWLLALVPAGVGYSRVCLGVHWPSDVVGGWAVALFFCALAWLLQADDRR